MAKELPYFKFEPSEWENGNIQMCSLESKGLFMDLCCMYWSRLSDLPLKLAIQKLCGGNASALNPLIDDGIIIVVDNMICIDFLNEQLLNFDNTSKQNSKNARLGWDKRRKESERNASALNPHSETDAIREDKSRVDKKKVDKSKEDKIIIKDQLVFSSIIMDCYYNILNHFPKDLQPTIQKDVDNWMNCIRLLIDTDGHKPEEIEYVVKAFRTDQFWAGNFQSLLKLRKKNKDGILYMTYFKNKIISDKQHGKTKGYDPTNFTYEKLNEFINGTS